MPRSRSRSPPRRRDEDRQARRDDGRDARRDEHRDDRHREGRRREDDRRERAPPPPDAHPSIALLEQANPTGPADGMPRSARRRAMISARKKKKNVLCTEYIRVHAAVSDKRPALLDKLAMTWWMRAGAA